MFPSWKAVSERYREVVLFVVGLMKDPRPLVHYLYEMQVENYLNEMRTGTYPDIDTDLFKSLHAESTVPLPHPLHNQYINHYNHREDERKKRPLDTTPVYWPSQVYYFWHMTHEVELDHHSEREEIPPCTMYIRHPRGAVSDSLLSICSEISKHQAVTNLVMWSVTCNSLEAPRLINPVMVVLFKCKLPDDFVEKILRQLFGSGESLQRLVLWNMNLAPFESLLDELLEDLVSHHQRKREAGLAQRKLELRLRGYKDEPNNLSSRFVKKWDRCKKVESIYCQIWW